MNRGKAAEKTIGKQGSPNLIISHTHTHTHTRSASVVSCCNPQALSSSPLTLLSPQLRGKALTQTQRPPASATSTVYQIRVREETLLLMLPVRLPVIPQAERTDMSHRSEPHQIPPIPTQSIPAFYFESVGFCRQHVCGRRLLRRRDSSSNHFSSNTTTPLF